VILEIADIRIPPGQNAAFEAAIDKGLKTVASRAQGFQGALFTEWRAIVGPFFAQPPLVEHFQLTTTV
jgi:hypothetical protein